MSTQGTQQYPTYCKNCTHRYVCKIQENIANQDLDVKKFNSDHAGTLQSISSINYNCRYKTIDPAV